MTQKTTLTSTLDWFKDPRNALSAAFLASGVIAVSSALALDPAIENKLVFTLHEQDETTTKVTYHSENFFVSRSFFNDKLQLAFALYGRNIPGEIIIVGPEGVFYNGTFDEKNERNVILTRQAPDDAEGCASYTFETTNSGTASLGVPWSQKVNGDITLCPQ